MYMKEKEILETIDELSTQQGFYCRVKNELDELRENNPEQYRKVIDHLVSRNFVDKVDLVMYMEGN